MTVMELPSWMTVVTCPLGPKIMVEEGVGCGEIGMIRVGGWCSL